MAEFIASNNIRVEGADDNERVWLRGTSRGTGTALLYPEEALALREFFLAEHDEKRGWWRSKRQPAYVVIGGPAVVVFHEPSGRTSRTYTRDMFPGTSGEFANVAEEYFAAHPSKSFTFTVAVDCESQEEAEQVMNERINHDEDYGFPYRISWRPSD